MLNGYKRCFVSCEMFSNINSITFSFQLLGNSRQLASYCRDICYTIHLSPCILLSQLMDFEWTSYPSSKLLEMKYITILEMDRQNRFHSSRHLILQILKIQQPFSANFVRKELLLKTNEVLFAKNIQSVSYQIFTNMGFTTQSLSIAISF